MVGEADRAILLLNMLLQDAPLPESEVLAEARKLLATLAQQPDYTPSVLDWIKSLLQQNGTMETENAPNDG